MERNVPTRLLSLKPARAKRARATVFGQPRGLATLFLTEMWERFTYYGMRSILILFAVAAVSDGGLGLDDHIASAIYGLYIAATYVFALFGGWMADRLLGAQRAVIVGGVLISCGNALLVLGSVQCFFVGLAVIVLGVGLLKPNISVIGGRPVPGRRRTAGCGLLDLLRRHQRRRAARLPARAALRRAIRLALGIRPSRRRHDPGSRSIHDDAQVARSERAQGSECRACLLASRHRVSHGRESAGAARIRRGAWYSNPIQIAAGASWVIALCAAAFFAYLIFFARLDGTERRRVYVMAALFAAYATFFAGFEQGGASLNLFAERYTNRHILGWILPAGVLQGTTALFTILFAPLFAALWIALGRRDRNPTPPVKFAIGLGLLGLGYIVMFFASRYVLGGMQVSPMWLLVTYFLQECGDLCLSPVGLSSMTKLAPTRFVGQVMGLWFLALALGNNLAGQLSGEYDAANLSSLPGLFLKICGWSLASAAVMVLLTPLIKRLMGGVR